MARLRYVVCDVFTDTPLTGNQLAVFTDGRGVSDELMQALALEVGFSETVFVVPAELGGTARIRIFNPRAEMPFAGHPALGAAFVLGAPLQRGVIELETGVGIVPVVLERDESGRIVFGRMEQPVPRVEPFEGVAVLLAAIGVESSILPVELYDNGARHILVTLDSERELAASHEAREVIAALGVTGVNCIVRAGRRLAQPHVLGARRGSGDGLRSRPDRLPSRPARPDRLGRRRSSSPRGSRSADPQPCTPAPRAPPG